jgi:hypothetical protein
MLLLMLAEVALAVVHDSVELPPLFTVLGEALSVQVGGFQTGTVAEPDLVGSAWLVAVIVTEADCPATVAGAV